MKKFIPLIALLISFSVVSCLDENDTNFSFEPLKIIAVEFPEDIIVNKVNKVSVTYIRPTTCHYFEGFNYEETAVKERTVTAIASVFEGSCEEISTDNQVTTTFDFVPSETGEYTFKFWTGEDLDGFNEYLIEDINVIASIEKAD